MKRLLLISFVGIFFSFISGCNTGQFGKPTSISLEQALTSVGTGLAGMREAQRAVPGAGGLIPSAVTITFDVGASATDNGSLNIQASAPTSSPVTVTAGGTAGTTISTNRSNSVTVTLTNILFAPSGIVADNPDTLDKLLTTLKNHGYDVYVINTADINEHAQKQVDTLLHTSHLRLQKLEKDLTATTQP
jgi:hypothetical protein